VQDARAFVNAAEKNRLYRSFRTFGGCVQLLSLCATGAKQSACLNNSKLPGCFA
jgi:hypothetical protein